MIHLIYFLVFIGTILFLSGIYGIYKILFKGFILSSNLNSLPQNIIFSDRDDYYISFPLKFNHTGCEFTLNSISNKDKRISFEENFFKFKFYRNNEKWREFYKFKIDIPGQYVLQNSSKSCQSNYDFIVAKAVSNIKKIFYIILLVFGFNLIGFGMFVLNSTEFQILVFGKPI
jgi:hypothetical protein